jgi:hypothetical protein
MGGCLLTIGFSDKIKTPQQALKDANDRGEQDRYENGHSYSGTMGMLCWRFVERTFIDIEDFEQFLHDKQKDDGIIARVKVIRETKPLIKARQDWRVAESAVWEANRWRGQHEPKGPTPAQKARITAKAEKAKAKYRKLLEAQAAKSKKTRFIGGGCASS